MSGLEELLARVEAATGPSTELDVDLCTEFEAAHFDDGLRRWIWSRPFADGEPCRSEPIQFTASLDAALALVERVLPGQEYVLDYGCGMSMCRLPLSRDDRGSAVQANRSDGQMALALLAALLRALTQDKDQ